MGDSTVGATAASPVEVNWGGVVGTTATVWHQTPPASGHVADWLEVLLVFSLQITWMVSFKRKKKYFVRITNNFVLISPSI